MVTREDVINAYEWILGRAPESEEVIESFLGLKSRNLLREQFLSSLEFKEFYTKRHMSIFRFVFIRVPKTASSSIVTSMERMGLSVAAMDDNIPDLGPIFQSNNAIAGHFSYGRVLPALKGIRPIFLAVLRNPERRAISLYRQVVDQQDHPCHDEVAGKTLLQALNLEGAFYQWVFNAQTWHISQHHYFVEAASIINGDHFMICDMQNIDRLLRVVSKLHGAPLVSAVPENVSSHQRTDAISGQVGYEKALEIIRWITVEDRKLIRHVNGFYASPRLHKLIDNRPGILD